MGQATCVVGGDDGKRGDTYGETSRDRVYFIADCEGSQRSGARKIMFARKSIAKCEIKPRLHCVGLFAWVIFAASGCAMTGGVAGSDFQVDEARIRAMARLEADAQANCVMDDSRSRAGSNNRDILRDASIGQGSTAVDPRITRCRRAYVQFRSELDGLLEAPSNLEGILRLQYFYAFETNMQQGLVATQQAVCDWLA